MFLGWPLPMAGTNFWMGYESGPAVLMSRALNPIGDIPHEPPPNHNVDCEGYS